MRISYDAEVDALYLEFRELAAGTAEARPLTDAITADYGSDGRIAGLEILDASKVLGQDGGHMVLDVSPAFARATR